MARSLDLVLLTDEPIDWEGDYWFRSNKKVEREMRSLDITLEDKETVEKRFGVTEYFRLLPPENGGANGNGNGANGNGSGSAPAEEPKPEIDGSELRSKLVRAADRKRLGADQKQRR